MTTAAVLAQMGSNNTTFRNRIYNGAMAIDQRNAGASVTPPTNGLSTYYLVDRFYYQPTLGSKFTFQQNAGSVTPPTGYTNYLGCTVASAYSVTATDTFNLVQSIEGFNVADLGWGTANAQAVTLSFWIRSSLTGTFGGSIYNASGNRSYPFTYTISAANTWEQKTVTIPGDTTGSWLTDNRIGISTCFNLGAGSNYSGTAGAWTGSWRPGATGATSVVGTNGATFYITGVQLEAGTNATPFEFRPYGTELALCQRYAYVLSGANNKRYLISGNYNSGGDGKSAYPTCIFPVTMRAAPSVTVSSASHFVFENYASAQVTPTSIVANSMFPESATLTVAGGSSFGGGGNLTGQNASAQMIFSAEL